MQKKMPIVFESVSTLPPESGLCSRQCRIPLGAVCPQLSPVPSATGSTPRRMNSWPSTGSRCPSTECHLPGTKTT